MSSIYNALNNLPFTQVDLVSFTSNGTYTPSAEVKYVWVEVLGGGGSGAQAYSAPAGRVSYGGGGAAGGYAAKLIQNPAPATIVIGLGGPGSTGGAGSSAGGNTTYDDGTNLLTGNGGSGGGDFGSNMSDTGGNVAPAVNGGTGAGGDVNVQGQPGQVAFHRGANRGTLGGGGSTKYGRGGAQEMVGDLGSDGGNVGTGFGAGGSGAGQGTGSARAGANGANGVVYIWEII